ncbi:MAG: methyl-accepting chemotaxis protein [Proteobacteria bacterium]|nr:methyl-accepting chemotaxis protein [Pseudomonadota bacterium]
MTTVNDRIEGKRSHYFIKKKFQTKFILRVILLVLIGMIVSSGLLFLFSQDTLTSSYQGSRLIIRNTGVSLLPKLALTTLITFFLIGIATMVVILFISHKIVGPLYRFETELKHIGEGDLTRRIYLRKEDQFTEIKEAMNSMIENLNSKVTEIKNQVEQMESFAASQQHSPENIMKGLSDLSSQIQKKFKL